MHSLEARKKLIAIQLLEFVRLSCELETRRIDDIQNLQEERKALGTEKYEELYGDDEREILAVYPQILRRSMFLLLYGMVESEMMEACRSELEPRFGLKLRELKDRGLTLVNTYLGKVAGIESDIELLGTEELAMLGTVRNKLIHANGRQSAKDEEKLLDTVSKFDDYRYEIVVLSGSIHFGSKLLNIVSARFRSATDSFYDTLMNHELSVR